MNTPTPPPRDRSLVVFFALAYGISWASFFLLGGPTIFTLGPFLAALLLAAVTGGVRGLRDLAGRILRWRVGPIWYAAAVLVPVAIGLMTAALTLLLGRPMQTPVRLGPWYSPLLLFAFLLFTGDTLFEETGWRAFALPRFPAHRSALTNTLILGVLLAGWHLPVALSESGALVPYVATVITSAVVTNWVYYNGGSALLAWLYHTSANTTGQLFLAQFSGENRVTYFWMLAGVNLVAAVVVVLATGRDLRGRSAANNDAILPPSL
jgi:membrane protease YdiL (CAAX protease family)